MILGAIASEGRTSVVIQTNGYSPLLARSILTTPIEFYTEDRGICLLRAVIRFERMPV